MALCSTCDERPATARGLCDRCYGRAKRAGALPPLASAVPPAAPSIESWIENARGHDRMRESESAPDGDSPAAWRERQEWLHAEHARIKADPSQRWEPLSHLFPSPGRRRAPMHLSAASTI
jgi:hypothetical protein